MQAVSFWAAVAEWPPGTRCFSNLISEFLGDELSSLCDFTIACLEKTAPRSWACSVHDSNIVVFTDGSFENGVGLWGAVVLDDANRSP